MFFHATPVEKKMKTCSFVWEVQLLLHPHTKNIDGMLMGIFETCGRAQRLSEAVIERNKSAVKQTVLDRLKAITMSLQPPAPEDPAPTLATAHHNGGFSEDLTDFFFALIDSDSTAINARDAIRKSCR
jgi:hypothetical protein